MVYLLELLYSYDQASQYCDALGGFDFENSFQTYVDHCLPECLPPNNIFAADETLLYSFIEAEQKECRLDVWKQELSLDSYTKLMKPHLRNVWSGEHKQVSQKLLKNNILLLTERPVELESMLGLGHNFTESYVLKALAKSNNHVLSLDAVTYLESRLQNYSKLDTTSLNLVMHILTNYNTHFSTDLAHTQLLIEQIIQPDFNASIRGKIINKFYQDILSLDQLALVDICSIFAQLLPFDTEEKLLVKGLIHAHIKYGYVTDLSMLDHFLQFLDDGTLRKDTATMLAATLVLELADTNPEVDKIEPYINKIFAKTATKEGELPLLLVDAVFSYYSEDQNYFTDIIIDLLAESKNLPTTLLIKLIPSLQLPSNPQVDLFIALRLSQYHLDLPTELLQYFIQCLSSNDTVIQFSAIKLFTYLSERIPLDIHANLSSALYALDDAS